ncbi:MAG: trypsin-like peptidase domain-containing protein [Candidatus Tectomicrobia bacterium]|nr:trypsin-like peptidase domain-containing protein [Candidatus Tectomicrobia bacterium]
MRQALPILLLAGALSLPAGVPGHAATSTLSFGDRTLIEAIKRLQPSVVHIQVKPKEEGGAPFGLFGPGKRKEGSPFHGFEGLGTGRFSVGAGLVVGEEGYILTNHHVIKEGTDPRVKLHGGEELPATVVGVDEKTDLALLKVDPPAPLRPAPLGDSDRVEVGEWVLAIGSPFGLAQSVSAGIISAKNRNLGEGPYDDYLQTDATINPGNSGGPLANSRGEVIGINTAIFSRGRQTSSMGLGFAIPINQAKAVIGDLRHKGYPVRDRMGVSLAGVTPEEARRLGLPRNGGAKLAEVVRGGPAEKAGLKRGGVIVEFGGTEVISWESLSRMVARARPGSEVEVTYHRGAQRSTARIRIGASPDAPRPAKGDPKDPFGMKVEHITPSLAQRFGLKEGQGLVITALHRDGPAQRGGVAVGDQIVEVNHQPVRTLADFQSSVRKTQQEGFVLLLLKRRDTNFFAALRAP